MSVRILVTGGTFDKEYDEITGKLYFKDTHMRDIRPWKVQASGEDPNVDAY